MTALIITAISLFPVAFALRNTHQFRECRSEDTTYRLHHNSRWHKYQAIVQLCFFALVAVLDWRLAILGMSFFWIVFDGIVNEGLGKPHFYVGTTAFIDKLYRRTNHPTLLMFLSKILFFIGAILLFFIF